MAIVSDLALAMFVVAWLTTSVSYIVMLKSRNKGVTLYELKRSMPFYGIRDGRRFQELTNGRGMRSAVVYQWAFVAMIVTWAVAFLAATNVAP